MTLEKDVLTEAGFIFSTQCALYRDIIKDYFSVPANKFDYAIVDEASQSFVGFSLMAIHMAKRVIFAGDHKQLPPVVKADIYTHILEKSLFERLVNASHYQGGSRYTLLDEQYRMNQQLMVVSNRLFYNNQVKTAPRNKDICLGELPGVKDCGRMIKSSVPLMYIDNPSTEIDHKMGKVFNYKEADIVLSVLIHLIRDMNVKPSHIGVITGYHTQRELITEMIENCSQIAVTGNRQSITELLMVSTVDSFQGKEREVIVYASTRANKTGNIGFLVDERRFNVAITRAKRLFVFVGCSATLTMQRENRHMREMCETAKLKGVHSKWDGSMSVLSLPNLK